MPRRPKKSKHLPIKRRQGPLKALPLCKGPKLKPFKNHHLPIRFIRLLSDPETAAHSHVFEVEIGSDTYALKVFRYYHLEDDEVGLSDCETEDPDIVFHIDPFFAECRAFGRIEESGNNGVLAVQCHGYLKIAAEREDELMQRFEAGDWDRPDEEYEQEVSQRQPLRAIVKKLVSEQTTWNFRTSKKILRNIRALNKLGVYIFDVTGRNLVGGQFVDFSTAWTEPHILFSTRDEDEVVNRRQEDLIMFDFMMEEQHVPNAQRALPAQRYKQMLRSANKPTSDG